MRRARLSYQATYLLRLLGVRHTAIMNDNLLALRLFARVASTGSFSAPSRAFDLSQPSVSRIIAALEKEVGAALGTRTSRAVTMTDVGIDYRCGRARNATHVTLRWPRGTRESEATNTYCQLCGD